MPHLRILPILLIGAWLLHPAYGQINPFRGSKAAPLTRDDISVLMDATNRLLDRPQLVAGGIETWNNPKSGASGTITAGQPLHRHGLSCRLVLYKTAGPEARPERSNSLTWCRTADGWKMG